MDVQLWLISFVLGLFLCTLGKRFYAFCVFVQKINKIPGPSFGVPFFGLGIRMMSVKKEDQLEWHRTLGQKFKDHLFRIWLGTSGQIEISKPEHIEVLLRSNIEVNKSNAFEHVRIFFEDGVSVVAAPKWYDIRKAVRPLFQTRVLPHFAEEMIEKSADMTRLIGREIDIHGDKPLELFGLSNRIALKIMSATVMGVQLGYQTGIQPEEYCQALAIITSSFGERMFRPWLFPDFIYYKTATGKKFNNAIQRIHNICLHRIDSREQERVNEFGKSDLSRDNGIIGTRKRKTILDHLLEGNKTRRDPLSKFELRDQMTNIMFAGQETSASLMTWTLFCVGVELDVQRKIQEELDEVMGDADDETTLKKMPDLKYLDRVIKEVLRMYPVVTEFGRELLNDLKIGDYIVPKGTVVNVQLYQLHRDPAIWPDPLRFDPDRFLPEPLKERHPFAYIPFSAGPRNCLGLKWGILETKIIVAQVLRKFNIRSIENHRTIKKVNNVTLKPLEGVFVRVTKRSDR